MRLVCSLSMLKHHFVFPFSCYSVCNAEVIGRSLSPVFMVDVSNPEGHSILKYLPGAQNLYANGMKQDDIEESLEWQCLIARYEQMNQTAVVSVLLGPHFMNEYDFINEYDEDGVSDDDPFE